MANDVDDASWDYVVVAVDVADSEREAVIEEVSEDFAREGLPIDDVRRGSWSDLTGAPPLPQVPGHFVVLEGTIAFILLGAAAGVIGNRSDAAVVAIAKRVKQRKGRPAPPLTRATALRRARGSIQQTWPDDAPATLDVDEEARDHEGNWEFGFAAVVHDGRRWAYRAQVRNDKDERAIAVSVKRRLLPP